MKRSKFSLSNYKLLTCNQGQLVPIGLTEVLPGDTIQHSTSALVRTLPLMAPLMHPVNMQIHHWFVPYRILWDDFEDFITGGPDGDDDSVYPTVALPIRTDPGDLADYMGIPLNAGVESVSALPFRAYNLIWNEFYRDQDLQTPLNISTASGVDATTSQVLQYSAWEKDYFTSSRVDPQKGPDILVPIGNSAPVVSTNVAVRFNTTDSVLGSKDLQVETGTPNLVLEGASVASQKDLKFGNQTGLEANLAAATGVDITLLREAFALQRMQEARGRYGSRFTEYLAYLGIRSSDARLQRPEYLGGGRQKLQVSEVLQTSPTADDPDEFGVGNLRGHGIGAMRSNRYRRFFEEHGIIISLLTVKPRTMYTQGIPRLWNRRTKEDFWQKELQAIGQQEVLNKEIYLNATDVDGVFGYQDRYDEYRRTESTIAGEFRTTLDFWHMARNFSAEPVLNASFVQSNPTDRVYAVGEALGDQLQIMAYHSMQARRLVAQTGKSFIY
nr:MAG: major capsid protein [Microvirus sp.]